jgi:DnaJ-domain-containing protein 1
LWSNKNLTEGTATVTKVQSVSKDGRYILVTLGFCKEFRLGHRLPGQFIQIESPLDRQRRILVTLASPPGKLDGEFQVLVDKFGMAGGWSSSGLESLRVGETLRISKALGRGIALPHGAIPEELFIFADHIHGFAAAHALFEWDDWRRSSGEGTVRKCQVRAIFFVDRLEDTPFNACFPTWIAYGIQVFPQLHETNLQNLLQRRVLDIRCKDGAAALICTSSDASARQMRGLLRREGLMESAIGEITQRTILSDISSTVRTDVRIGRERVTGLDRDAAPNAVASETTGHPTGTEGRVSASHLFRTDHEGGQATYSTPWRIWCQPEDLDRLQVETDGSASNSHFVGDTYSDRYSAPSDVEVEDTEDMNDEWEQWFASNTESWSVRFDDEIWNSYWKSWEQEQARWASTGGDWTAFTQNSWQGNSSAYQSNTNRREGWGSGAYTAGHASSDDYATGSDRGFASTFGSMDLYAVLGVSKTASQVEIKKAYRALAREWHPDMHRGNNDEATRRMQRIVFAYSVLRDESSRRRYDLGI